MSNSKATVKVGKKEYVVGPENRCDARSRTFDLEGAKDRTSEPMKICTHIVLWCEGTHRKYSSIF